MQCYGHLKWMISFQKDIPALLDLPYPEQAGYGLTFDQLVLESS